MLSRKSLVAVALSVFSFGCQDSTTALPGKSTEDTTTVVSTKPWKNGALTISTIGSVGLVSERITAEIAADGNVAYTTTWGCKTGGKCGNAVKIWNVSGNTPVLVDSLIVADGKVSTTSDVQISDGDKKLLVTSTEGSSGSGAIQIYDRTNPLKPVLISTFSSSSTLPGVHTVKLGHVGSRYYAFLQIDPSPVQTVIVDITTPQAPVEVTKFVTGAPLYVHDVFFRDGYLFAGYWDEGLKIFDVGAGTSGGTISSPKQIGAIVTTPGLGAGAPKSEAHNIYWYKDPAGGAFANKYAFVGQEGSGGVGTSSSGDIHVIDVTNFAAPKEVAFYSVTGAGTHNFAVDEANGILYAAYYNGGVRAIDIRGDLSTCTDAQRVTDPLKARCDLRLMKREAGVWLPSTQVYIWGVALVGTKLYASDMINGIWKLDISNIHP